MGQAQRRAGRVVALAICVGLVPPACTGPERTAVSEDAVKAGKPSPTPVEIRRAEAYMVSLPGRNYVRPSRLVIRGLRRDFKRFEYLSYALRNFAVRTVFKKRAPIAIVVAVVLDEALSKSPRTRSDLFLAMGVKKVPTMGGFRIAGEHVSTAQLPFGFGAVSWQDGRAFVLVLSPQAVEGNRILEALIRGRGSGSAPLSKNPLKAVDPESLFGARRGFTYTTAPGEVIAELGKELNKKKTARLVRGWASRLALHQGTPVGIVASISVKPSLVAFPKFRKIVIQAGFGRGGKGATFSGRSGMQATPEDAWIGAFWRGTLFVVVGGPAEYRDELRSLAKLLAR